MATKEKSLEDTAIASLGPLAKQLQKTAGSLWNIFVWKYRAQGVAELFSAGAAIWLSTWLFGAKSLYDLPFFIGAVVLTYFAIQHLLNPQYPAMGDVIVRVGDINRPKVEVVQRYFKG